MGLSEAKIALLRAFVNYNCDSCGKNEDKVGKLEPHRVKQGGDYSLVNIKMVCSKCHGIFSSAQRIASGTQSR